MYLYTKYINLIIFPWRWAVLPWYLAFILLCIYYLSISKQTIINKSNFQTLLPQTYFFIPKWEAEDSVTRARRGQWPRTPVYLNEVLGSAPPPGQGRWTSVWRGGLGSATSRGIDRIKLDLSEINTKERRATHTSRWGRGRDTRRRNISWRKHKTWTFFPLFIYISNEEGPRWILFFSSKRRY